MLPYDRDLHLIANSPYQIDDAVRRLSLIGLDRVASWSGPESLETLPQVESYRQGYFSDGLPDDAIMLDVRNHAEYEEANIPGSVHIPLGYLSERIEEIPVGRTVAVYCQGGGRSPIAASLLKSKGIRDVIDLQDGFNGYLGVYR